MTHPLIAIAQAAIPAQAPAGELAAAVLQATITAGLAILCVMVWRKSREPHFAWWSVAFGLYVARIGMIIAFLTTLDRAWLFWHQVVTGWVALALLWAAFVFASRREWKAWYWLLLAFPLLWSYVAVIRLENFTLAAVPAVLFISGATLWTGTQKVHFARDGVAKLLGLPQDKVHAIWVPGPGSYGRNDAGDAALDAALVSKLIGKPVRLQYMRQDATAWDPKGPAAVYRGRAALDAPPAGVRRRVHRRADEGAFRRGARGDRGRQACPHREADHGHARRSGRVAGPCRTDRRARADRAH